MDNEIVCILNEHYHLIEKRNTNRGPPMWSISPTSGCHGDVSTVVRKSRILFIIFIHNEDY